MKHVARKRFGQHFLSDAYVLGAIVDLIDPQPGQAVVEIGPGLGAMTWPLLQRCQALTVIELDRDLAARLRERAGLTVIEADVLRVDFGALAQRMGQPLRLVGNLPYNISTPLLFHVANSADRCSDLHFMLQQEVVDRMVARPSHPDYGRFSVMLQYRFRMERLFTVPPEAFRPMPKVHSACVRLVPRPSQERKALDELAFAKVVVKAFSMRRKTLRNALHGLIPESELVALGIDPGARAQTLPVEDFVTIANRLAELPS